MKKSSVEKELRDSQMVQIRRKTDNLNNYRQLKSDIIALKEYIAELYSTATEFGSYIDDVVITEMNDLLFGIERGQIVMPYKQLNLASAYHATDGAFRQDVKLEKMIYTVQHDIYSIRKFIVVLQKPKLFFRRKNKNINWLFPNLDCKTGYIQCLTYCDEDMLKITFPNGYEIDLGFLKDDNSYIITITKDNNCVNIIEEQRIKLRSTIEENLQKFIYKYENL